MNNDESYFFDDGVRAKGAPGNLVAARGWGGSYRLYLPRDLRLI